MNPTIVFLLSFLGLNFLIFLPNWVIGRLAKQGKSKISKFSNNPWYIIRRVFYRRFGDDPFRFLFEIYILCFLLLLFPQFPVPLFRILVVLFSVFGFSYIVYIQIIIKIFRRTPSIGNDYNFAKTGWLLYGKLIPILLFAVVLLLIFVGIVSNFLAEKMTEAAQNSNYSWFLIAFLILWLPFAIRAQWVLPYPVHHYSVNFSFVKHAYYNYKRNLELHRSLKNLRDDFPYQYNKDLKLRHRPNIILGFLESYGSYAFSNLEFAGEFKEKMQRFKNSLQSNGWYCASTLSRSPIMSGGSWLSHSSVFFGATVRDIAAHEIIFNLDDYAAKLDSLPNFLRENSYKTLLTSSLSYRESEVNWGLLTRAYPIDEVLLVDQFEYSGKMIPMFRDRYTIPDEYTLNYAFEYCQGSNPFFLCFSSTNSHYNFNTPIKAMKHWQDYNTHDFEIADGRKKNDVKNYFTAINYHFDYLQKFFENQNLDDDTVMILIGDHQPPMITPADVDQNTPIHIIAKNPNFVNAFKDFDYSDGMIPKESSVNKHEAFFSKFMFALNRAYGVNHDLDLPIFNNGIDLY